MAKTKKTGIKWLPEIAEDFSVGFVKQYFNISKDLSNEGEPERVLKLARAGIVEKDVTTNEGQMAASYEGYNKVEVGDLMLNPMDLYSGANCNVSELSGVISPAYSNLRAKDKSSLCPKYYDYYFKTQYWTMAMFAHGKGVSFDNRWTLNNDALKSYEIPVISYETQQKIVSAIESKTTKIDALIANEEKQIEKLKSYKQSLITETVTKGLDKNAKMKDSGVEWIGEIPEGWECRKLKTLVTDIGDIDHYMPESVINGFPYVMTGDLKSNVSEIDFEKCKMVSKEEFDKLSKKIKAEKGDLIFARYATIGTVCFVDIDKEFLVSYSCVVIKIKKDELFGKYLNYYIQSNSFLEEAKKYTNSNTQGNVGISSLNEMLITLPELKKQNEIINFLDNKCTQIDKLISLKESKIEKLNAYKKSLIYEYVTGKKEA